MFPRLELQGHSRPCITHDYSLSNGYETKKHWSGRKRVRLRGMSCLEAALWLYFRIYSCGWPFSDDGWLERSQTFSAKMTLFMAVLCFCLWVLMQHCFISWHHDIPHFFDFQSHIWAPPLEYGSQSSHWFSNWEWDLEAARHRQPPLFPFVRHDDDLTGSRMPTSAPLLSPDFINWKAAVNYQSIL